MIWNLAIASWLSKIITSLRKISNVASKKFVKLSVQTQVSWFLLIWTVRKKKTLRFKIKLTTCIVFSNVKLPHTRLLSVIRKSCQTILNTLKKTTRNFKKSLSVSCWLISSMKLMQQMFVALHLIFQVWRQLFFQLLKTLKLRWNLSQNLKRSLKRVSIPCLLLKMVRLRSLKIFRLLRKTKLRHVKSLIFMLINCMLSSVTWKNVTCQVFLNPSWVYSSQLVLKLRPLWTNSAVAVLILMR